MRTHQILTAAGIPCTVVLDSAVGYVMERVDMVLLGCEAVVESGALVSSVGTYQVALVAKANQKPVYALAESYKFLRHYPLSQTDLPMPRQMRDHLPLSFAAELPGANLAANFPMTTPSHSRRASIDPEPGFASGTTTPSRAAIIAKDLKMSKEMEDLQPPFDVTYPELVEFIITDLGSPLSPTSVSQYLVAQFSE
jgi:translation initiation factor eIF-2B subunit alpha